MAYSCHRCRRFILEGDVILKSLFTGHLISPVINGNDVPSLADQGQIYIISSFGAVGKFLLLCSSI